MGSDDVIIPGMANLSFNIELSSTVDANRTLVSNIGRAIIKKLAVLCYELTFNDYNRVTKSGVSSPKVPDAKYKITDISLEYEIATQPDLASSIRSEYQHMALLYDRILRHRKIIVNKSDTAWNWAFNIPCKSLKGILVLFEEEGSYTRDTSKFYNPKIQKVSVIVEGKPNQLYTQRMRSFEHSQNEIV